MWARARDGAELMGREPIRQSAAEWAKDNLKLTPTPQPKPENHKRWSKSQP